MAAVRALALLATHRSEHERARAEAAGRPAGTPSPLPFLRSCLLESLRLWPTTPATLRDSTEPTSWQTASGGSGTVPAGSAFLILTPPLHRDRDRFDLADAFVPDIWLDGRADELRPLVPFSAGPAGCPGRNLALFTSSTVLSVILASFDRLVLVTAPTLRPDRALPPTLNHYGIRFAVA